MIFLLQSRYGNSHKFRNEMMFGSVQCSLDLANSLGTEHKIMVIYELHVSERK